MNKKEELLCYLEDHLFFPVLNSPYASSQLKYNFSHIREILQSFSAEGILSYVWNTLASPESKMIWRNRLMDEGFLNYTETLDSFKTHYTYEWLLS